MEGGSSPGRSLDVHVEGGDLGAVPVLQVGVVFLGNVAGIRSVSAVQLAEEVPLDLRGNGVVGDGDGVAWRAQGTLAWRHRELRTMR